MKFAVNYFNKEFNSKYLFDDDIYIKYPGFRANLEELKELVTIPEIKNKVLLHGIVSSSGSIFDKHLCDNIVEWLKIFKKCENNCISLHFYYESKFCSIEDAENVCLDNIKKLRNVLPGIQIAIENVPYAYEDNDWCCNPEVISYYCKKYNLKFLLDISHMCTYSFNKGINLEEYFSKIPFDEIVEIHLSNNYKKGDKYFDSHFECDEKIYELYERVLKRTNTVKMTTIEFPVYNNIPEVIDFLKQISCKKIYDIQKFQIEKVKKIYEKIYKD